MPRTDIYIEEREAGIGRKDRYRIICKPSIEALVAEINRITSQERWDIVSGAFHTEEGWCQTMAKLPKEKLARQSLA